MTELSELKGWLETRLSGIEGDVKEMKTELKNIENNVGKDYASIAVMQANQLQLRKDVDSVASLRREDAVELYARLDAIRTELHAHQEDDNKKFTALWIKVAGISTALAAGGFYLGNM